MYSKYLSYLILSLIREYDIYKRILEYSDKLNINNIIVIFSFTSSLIISDIEIL